MLKCSLQVQDALRQALDSIHSSHHSSQHHSKKSDPDGLEEVIVSVSTLNERSPSVLSSASIGRSSEKKDTSSSEESDDASDVENDIQEGRLPVYEFEDDGGDPLPRVAEVENDFNSQSMEDLSINTGEDVTASVLGSVRDAIVNLRAKREQQKKKDEDRKTKIEKAIKKAPDGCQLSFFFVLLGVVMACIAVGMDVAIDNLHRARFMFANLSNDMAISWALWTSFILVLVISGVLFTHFVGPGAIGSGIPQMKTILTGAHLKGLLDKRTLVAKVIGLTLLLGSGLIVGKEGPFVHLSCIVAYQLLQIRVFERARKTTSMQNDIMAAASSLGVAANFGAPLGGIMFSIEVTSTYYATRSYWFAAATSSVGGLLFKFLWGAYRRYPGAGLKPIFGVDFVVTAGWIDVAALIVLGGILGLMGLLIIYLFERIALVRRAFLHRTRKLMRPLFHNLIYVVLVCLVTGALTFPRLVPHLALPSQSALMRLVEATSMNGTLPTATDAFLKPTWFMWGSVEYGLAFFLIIRLILQILAFTVPAPLGIYVPVAVLGAVTGRMVGEFMNHWFPGQVVSPAVYAIVGAGALPGSVTHAVSTAVVIVEVTGTSVSLPLVLLTTVIAYVISRSLYRSAYDVMGRLQKLPFLPTLELRRYRLKAKHIMEDNVHNCFLYEVTNLKQIRSTLRRLKSLNVSAVPLCRSVSCQPVLIGTLDRRQLKDFAVRFASHLKSASHTGDNFLSFRELAEQPINVLANLSTFVRSSPMTFRVSASMAHIHRIFALLQLSDAFVTRYGVLKGIITRSALVDALQSK